MRLRQWDGLPQNSADIIRKFGDTFVKAVVPELGDQPKVVKLNNFEGDYCHVSYQEQEPAGGARRGRGRAITCEWPGVDVLESWPNQVGAIPFFDKVLLLKRVPARQWQVGLCAHNSSVWDHRMVLQNIGFAEAEALYNPVYEKVDITSVVKRFHEQEKLEAFALNPVYWVARKKDQLVLYRNMLPLGSFTYGKFLINTKCSDFRQELWDDLRLRV